MIAGFPERAFMIRFCFADLIMDRFLEEWHQATVQA